MIINRDTLDLYGKMLFETATVKPPFALPNPMPEEACLLFIKEGSQHAYGEVESIVAKEKESLLMKCGNYVAKMKGSDVTGHYQAVAIHFYPEILKRIFSNEIPSFLKSQGNLPTASIAKFKENILFEKYFDSILFYFENRELVTEDILVLKVKELLLLLNQTSNAPSVRTILSNLFSQRTYKFKEIIEKHLYDNLKMTDLCELTNLSLSSFKREFKKVFGESPGRYIKMKKLEKARELLAYSDLNVTQITFECGFNDLATFSAAFKEFFKTSPSSYRQLQQT